MYDKLTVLLDKIWSSDFAVNIIGGLLVLIIDLSVTYLIIGSVIERRERKKYGMARKEYAIEFLQQYSALKEIVPSSVRDLEKWAEDAHRNYRYQTTSRAQVLSADIVEAGAEYDKLLQILRKHHDDGLDPYYNMMRNVQSYDVNVPADRIDLLRKINFAFERLIQVCGLSQSNYQRFLWTDQDIRKQDIRK